MLYLVSSTWAKYPYKCWFHQTSCRGMGESTAFISWTPDAPGWAAGTISCSRASECTVAAALQLWKTEYLIWLQRSTVCQPNQGSKWCSEELQPSWLKRQAGNHQRCSSLAMDTPYFCSGNISSQELWRDHSRAAQDFGCCHNDNT